MNVKGENGVMSLNNISIVSEAYLCSNCGACKAICPKSSVSFRFSPIGRMYASVDENSCVNCGLCTKVCPALDKANLNSLYEDRYVGEIKNVYVGRCADWDYFKNSQSGGVCTAILAYMFDCELIDAAIVTEMFYGTTPQVKSVIVTRKEELYKSQKSCYTPVDVLSLLKDTKSYKSVAIVGLPCHIQGLVSLQKMTGKFLNVKYKLGLVCDRTLCKGIQDVITSFSPRNGSECIINWRKKNFSHKGTWYPYNSAPVVILYKNENYKHVLPNTYRFALKDMFTSPRCRVCYDKINSFADVVLGDPWRMGNTDEEMGASVVAVRTELGMRVIDEACKSGVLDLEERDTHQLVTGQLVEERRRYVAKYSLALECFPQKIDSYLYKQGEGIDIDKKEINQARISLQEFVTRDKQSIDLTIKDSYKVINHWLKIDRRNKNIIIRIIRKLKTILSI